MSMLKCSARYLSGSACKTVNFLSPIRITNSHEKPQKVFKSHISKSVKGLQASDCVVLNYSYNGDGSNYKMLNQNLADACASIPERAFGIASLTSSNMELSIAEIESYSESDLIRAFSLECQDIAARSEGYKAAYFLLELCVRSSKPVVLNCSNATNTFQSTSLIAQALCQIINDGILDFYPDLKLVVQSEFVIPQLICELQGNTPATSLQKHPIDHYLALNIFCISSCSDESYIQYLIGKLGSDRILFGSTNCVEIPDFSSLSQLVHQKIMLYNAQSLLKFEETTIKWSVDMDKVTVLDKFQSVQLLSSKLRDTNTDYKDFMIYGDRLMNILAEEALARIPSVVPKNITTPTGVFKGLQDLRDRQLCVVSIIRSGDILLEAVRKLVPGIRVGKILVQRDEETVDKKAVLFYQKLPKDISDCYVMLVDPMLATGGSLICAMEVLCNQGVLPSNVMFINLFSVEEGLQNVQERFPEMKIVTLSIDDYLNEDKYIVPGVGDFGDRYYGTDD